MIVCRDAPCLLFQGLAAEWDQVCGLGRHCRLPQSCVAQARPGWSPCPVLIGAQTSKESQWTGKRRVDSGEGLLSGLWANGCFRTHPHRQMASKPGCQLFLQAPAPHSCSSQRKGSQNWPRLSFCPSGRMGLWQTFRADIYVHPSKNTSD